MGFPQPSGSGTSLTVEDEGVPLATAASTLDFVGAGVTATGVGAEKTITIPGGSTMELIARSVVGAGGAASIDFTSIPATYETLVVDIIGRGDSAADFVELRARFNNDSGNNYDWQHMAAGVTVAGTGTAAGSSMRVGTIPAATGTAAKAGPTRLVIPGYARTVWHKAGNSESGLFFGGIAASDFFRYAASWLWRNTAAVNRLTLLCSAGNFAEGSMAAIYGIKGA